MNRKLCVHRLSGHRAWLDHNENEQRKLTQSFPNDDTLLITLHLPWVQAHRTHLLAHIVH